MFHVPIIPQKRGETQRVRTDTHLPPTHHLRLAHTPLEALRDAGVGNVLLNGRGARGRESLRRFARDIMPRFAEAAPQRVAV